MAEQLASFDLLWPDEVHGRPEESLPLEEPDDHLIAGLRAGDEVAYEALLGRYQQPVFNFRGVGVLPGRPMVGVRVQRNGD